MELSRNLAESWWTPRMLFSPTEIIRWENTYGQADWAILYISDVKGKQMKVLLKAEMISSLQVLTVADLGLNLSQNFTIRWVWRRWSPC